MHLWPRRRMKKPRFIIVTLSGSVNTPGQLTRRQRPVVLETPREAALEEDGRRRNKSANRYGRKTRSDFFLYRAVLKILVKQICQIVFDGTGLQTERDAGLDRKHYLR